MRTVRTVRSCLLISTYLAAIVIANFAVSHFGQAALPVTAFFLIPLDLVTRDLLHEEWEGRWLWSKMFVLIFSGSCLTAMLSWDARRVAIASCVAFASAGAINAFVYHLMNSKPRFVKMNSSNAAAAITDSVLFPLIAFDVVSGVLCVTQAVTKFGGGIFWSFVFVKGILRKELWR